MTNQERAESILAFTIDSSDVKECEDFITSQLDEAVSDALKDREIAYEKDLQMRLNKREYQAKKEMAKDFRQQLDEDVREAEYAMREAVMQQHKDQWVIGFEFAREKAADLVEFKSGMTDTRHELAERIRSLKASSLRAED